jgi:hypothetical protein
MGTTSIDTSPTTGEQFYSGNWTDVKNILSVLNIGDGKMDRVNQELINNYQEMVDREIDGILGEIIQTPLRAMNQVQPNGLTKRVFPGDVVSLARYWTAGLLLLNEFQQLAQNISEQATSYIDESKKKTYALKKGCHRMRGQDIKSSLSRTVPPSMQPPSPIEADY